jgi:putative peptidoglycan lipid II flippase
VTAQPAVDGAAAPARVARSASLIAALTVASRVAGFGRTLVFAWAVGATALGGIYQSANTVPNIIFEIVAGGALASLVVPLLADAVARGDRAAVGATTSALLTWVLTVLVPVAVGVALLAGPIVALLDRDAAPSTLDVGADMLRVFAPQLPLYGIGIVLTGVLQAHRRFAWPVVAPLLSSVAVVAAYGVFAVVAGRKPEIGQVGTGEVLVLSVGTTLGVVVLSLCLLVPLRRFGLRLRPTYRFEGEASRAVRRLAIAGGVTVAAQQLTLGLAIALANGGPDGSVVLYGLAQTIYLLPWAVLALPIATSVFPALAESAALRDRAGYAATLAPAARGLVLFGCLGAGALAALAGPLARLLAGTTAGPQTVGPVAAGIAGFAPGLVGYALFALLSRALYARGDTHLAAGATVIGWAVVAVASIGLAGALPRADRVAALAWANSAGMLVLGGVLVAVVARRAGGAALSGFARAGLAGVVAAGAAAAAGIATLHLTPDSATALGQGMLCGTAVGTVFLGVAYALDRPDVAPALAAVARRVRRARS